MLLKIVLLALVCQASCYKILGLFPHPGRSHHYVFEPLLLHLASRGHELTVVSHMAPKNIPPGWRQINMGHNFDMTTTEVIDLGMFDGQGLTGKYQYLNEIFFLGDLGMKMCQVMIDLPDVQSMVRNHEKFDLILVEQFISDCSLGIAHLLDAPFVSLQSHTLMPWTYERFDVPYNPSYMPNLFVGLPARMSFFGRLENIATHLFFKYARKIVVEYPEHEMLQKHFNRSIPPFEDIAKECSLLISNTHYILNTPKPLVPSVLEVAGIHIKRTMDPLSPELEQFINSSTNGIILFSMGSMIIPHTFPRHKLQYFFKIFSELKENIIWKWDGEIFEDMPKNVYVMKWVPQLEILHHPKTKAFIAHGGMLGTLEALHAGVPTLFMPVYGDQRGNAAAAELRGLGVNVPFRELTEPLLRNAMARILSPSMQKSAASLSAAWRDAPHPLDVATEHVEHVIRHGGRLRISVAQQLSFCEYYLLDVGLCVLAVLVASALVARKLIRLVGGDSAKRKLD